MPGALLAVIGAFTALAVAASPALAVQSKQSLTASISPVEHANWPRRAPSTRRTSHSTVHPQLVASNKQDTPFATEVVIKLDRNISFGGYKLPAAPRRTSSWAPAPRTRRSAAAPRWRSPPGSTSR